MLVFNLCKLLRLNTIYNDTNENNNRVYNIIYLLHIPFLKSGVASCGLTLEVLIGWFHFVCSPMCLLNHIIALKHNALLHQCGF